jgi:cell division protein FtsQ
VYRRGEKMASFFKRGTIFFLMIIFLSIAFLGVKSLKQKFYVREILVFDNNHLDTKEIIASAKIQIGDSFFDINLNEIDKRLKQNTWIKKVTLRKQFPNTLIVKVQEAVPKALLSRKKRLYLVDEDGKILERIKGETTHFLPLIKDISPKNEKGMSEAIKMVEVLSKKKFIANKESVEIGIESYGLTLRIDGELIKVGYGNYSAKFDRWIELEPEIRRKGLPIKYVDLRFKDSVIVKPLKPVRGETS